MTGGDFMLACDAEVHTVLVCKVKRRNFFQRNEKWRETQKPTRGTGGGWNFRTKLTHITTIIMTSYRSIFSSIILITTSLHSYTTASKPPASPYLELASYLSKSLPNHTPEKIQSTLATLSKAQSTFKTIDGASHEFYQRSHSNTIKGSSGRVDRSAGRVGCCADSLFGCELLDYVDAYSQQSSQQSETTQENEEDGTLGLNRKILLNTTIHDPLPIQIVVIYEDDYRGGAGMNHGGIDGLTPAPSSSQRIRGRYIIILKDLFENDLEKTLGCLDSIPDFFELEVGLVSGEVASVNTLMWKAAGKVLEACTACLSKSSDEDKKDCEKDSGSDGGEKTKDTSIKEVDIESLPALHFVGRSLAGGVASLAAAIVDGSIPMPAQKKKRSGSKTQDESAKRKRRKGRDRGGERQEEDTPKEKVQGEDKPRPSDKPTIAIHGFGSGRSSAIALGAPPSISANIKAAFITSVIVGDDIICRTTKHTLDRLRQRATRRLEGGMITKQVGWMTDALSLTMSSIQSHAHGSEGEEARLSIPGKLYLVKPRRVGGGVSSMHEIGRGSRDALRAAVLWQLNDVLLSRSLWKHHYLESYIQSLDKVQLREIGEEEYDEDEYETANEYM